jgi:hypothetical protein
MLPSCTCDRGGAHHHAFGGTYLCKHPEPCVGCRGPEFREPSGLPKPHTD